MTPQLSILIPSIPSRFGKAQELYARLLEMVGDKDIHVIMLIDNKVMSIGAKQNYLLNMVESEYFCIVHDDDELLSLEEIYDATFLDVDVITSKTLCYNADGTTYVVTHGIGNEIEHVTKDGKYLDCNRPPWTVNVWRNKFRHFKFRDIGYSEDAEWVKEVLPYVATEHYIDKVIYSYNFSETGSEAPTHSNPYWKNPNHESDSQP